MRRTFGPIPNIAIGHLFQSRKELSQAGVHRPLRAGISGSGLEGADSIVIAGRYEDDLDEGSEIIYAGFGGNDPKTGKQVADQELTLGNVALVVSQQQGLPVRVVRGANGRSPFSPAHGYRYDGLYYVRDHWPEPGRSGFLIWRFKLVADEATPPPPRRASH